MKAKNKKLLEEFNLAFGDVLKLVDVNGEIIK